MSSKKHRPIVMNRNKISGRTYKMLKRAALITAVLAFIEVIVLLVIHHGNSNKPVAKKPEKAQEMPKVAVRDTQKAIGIIQPKVMAENKQKDTAAKKDSVEIIKPAAEKTTPVGEKIQPTAQKPIKDTAISRPVKPKEMKTAQKVSNEKMFEILNEVRIEKMKANNPAKCISIQIVNSTNAENGSMIANYLRKNGYVISGREVIKGSQKGIQINAEGPCVKLAIGTL